MKRYAFQLSGFSKEREKQMREQISREVKEEMLQQTNTLKQQLEDIQEELQQRQPKKRRLTDPITYNQFGSGKKKVQINVISPTQQAVNQAKALIAYKRKLKQRKTKKKQNGRATRRTLGLGKQKSGRGRAVRGL
jgi:hypothetical protein